MRKLIFLHTADHNPDDKKLSIKDEFSSMKITRDAAFIEFRKDVKSFSLPIKIVSEHEVKPEVVIDYSDEAHEEVMKWLRKTAVVEIIDSIL